MADLGPLGASQSWPPNDEVPAPLTDAQRIQKLRDQTNSASRYLLGPQFARGGMGAIHKVYDTDLRRTLAMKVILPGSGYDPTATDSNPMVSRFVEEAQVTGQLDHPGVVPLHELGVDENGHAYFTMQLVRGQELKQVFQLVREGDEDWTQTRVLDVLFRVCETMAYAHDKGVIHRDLKPANIMVGAYGEVYVMDWGLARVEGRAESRDVRPRPVDESLHTDRRAARAESQDSPLYTMDGSVLGTPCYIPPEQASGQLDRLGPQSDVYAVGAMLYELISGQMPYAPPGALITAYEVLMHVVEGPPTPLGELAPGAPSELVAICEHAMARAPGDRYPSMREFADDLRAYREGRVVKAHATGALPELTKWIKRNRTVAASVAAALLLLIVGIVLVGNVRTRAERDIAEASQKLVVSERERADESNRRAKQQEQLTLRANKSAELAKTQAAIAKTERERADKQERWQAYVANLNATQMDLVLKNTGEARRRLALCAEDLRGWEWSHLSLTANAAPLVLRGPADAVRAIKYSPDGTRIASAYADGTTRIWDARDGKTLTTFGGQGAGASDVAWSPDGKRVVTAIGDNLLRIGDAGGSGRALGVIAVGAAPRSVDWRGTPERIAVGLDNGAIELWDPNRLTRVANAQGHEAPVRAVALDSGGQRVVSCGEDGRIKVWKGDLTPVADIDHGEPVQSMAFDEKASRIVAPRKNGTILVYDAVGGGLVQTLKGRPLESTAVAFLGDGSLVVFGSREKTLRFRNTRSGALHSISAEHDSAIGATALSPDGKHIAAGSESGSVQVLAVLPEGPVVALDTPDDVVSSLRFDKDGGRILSIAGGYFRIWDATTSKLTMSLKFSVPQDELRASAFSRDGNLVAASTQRAKQVIVWDARDADVEKTTIGVGRLVTSLAFSPDGKRLITSDLGNGVHVWDVDGGTRLATLKGPEKRVLAFAFSDDGKRVAGAAQDTSVWMWDVESGSPIHTFRGHDAPVQCVTFSGDGKLLATGSTDQTVRLWDARKLSLIRVLHGHSDTVTGVAFSADDARLVTASSDHSLRLWSVEVGATLATLWGHTDQITCVAFDPADENIVSGSVDETLRLWTSSSERVDAIIKARTEAGSVPVPMVEEIRTRGAEPAFGSIVLAVIVHKDNPVDKLTMSELKSWLKLRRQFWPNKQRASLYLPPHKLPTYKFLLERVYKMDHKKLQKYWTRKLFSGDIPAKPSSVPSEAAAGRLVAKDPGALSVVDASEIPEGVKVLRIDGKVPGEEGYPLGTDE